MEKVFDFNEHGVCTNPNVFSFVSGRYKVMIETAMIDDKWDYGFWLDTPNSGWVNGISKNVPDPDLFKTENEAIARAAARAIEWFEHEVDWHNKAHRPIKVPQFIFDELKKLLKPQRPKPVQLSLFDF